MLSFVLKSKSFGTVPLKYAPIGWDKMTYQFLRSEEYAGITKKVMSDQLGFIKDGKEYIQSILNAKGIEEEIIIEAYEENNFVNELIYTGKIDLTSYEQEDEVLSVDVEQSGFTMKFLNQDEVPIDISKHTSLKGAPITIINPLDVPLHSKVITRKFEGAVTDDFYLSEVFFTEDSSLYMPFSFQNIVSNELLAYSYFFSFVPDPVDVFELIDIEEDGNYLFEIDMYLRYLAYDFYGLYGVSISLDMQVNEDPVVRLINEAPLTMKLATAENYLEYGVETTKISDIYRLLYNETYAFKAGDKVKFYMAFKTIDDSSNCYLVQLKQHPITLKPSVFKITADTTFKETTCSGLLPFEAFTRVCEAITDTQGTFESTLFGRTDSVVAYDEDGPASLYLCTDGKQIRKLPIADHPLTFNFKDLFNSFDAKHNIGVGIEKRDGREVIVIEKKEYFFKDVMIADLGKVNNIVKTPAREYFANTIKVGYDKFENEVVNGIDEICTEVQYSTPITQVKNEYKRLSPYRSDGYGIETARRFSDSPTTDSSYDEDNFLICLLRDGEGFRSEKASQFDYIQNVISPETIYNGRDTPARMIRRHGNQIKAGLLFHQSENLKHVKGKNNAKMLSKLITETAQVLENADISIEDLNDPLIIPQFHEFEHKAKSSLIKLTESEPYGYYKYTDKDDIEYKSYIHSVEFSEGKAQFKLLLKNG